MTYQILIVLLIAAVLLSLYGLIIARPLFHISKILSLSIVAFVVVSSLFFYSLHGVPWLAFSPPSATTPVASLLNQSISLIKQDPNKSVSIAIQASRQNPTDTELILASRIIRETKPDHPEIITLLKKVLKTNPDNLEAIWFLASNFYKKKEYEKAMPLILKAKSMLEESASPENSFMIEQLNAMTDKITNDDDSS